jgi:hypothetical protein
MIASSGTFALRVRFARKKIVCSIDCQNRTGRRSKPNASMDFRVTPVKPIHDKEGHRSLGLGVRAKSEVARADEVTE